MTLTTTHNRMAYVGNGATTVFPYTFLITAAADLVVYHDGTEVTTGFTVSGVGVGGGGNVTYSVAPADDVVIHFIRYTDQTQQVDLIEGDRLPAEAVEGMFDKVYAVAQDLAERLDRTVRIPPTSEFAEETIFLPDPADEANQGKALFISEDGTALEARTILSSDVVSPISTQGDLIRGSSAATPERLPVGTAGQILTVVTGQAAWATPSASGIQSTLIDAKGDLVAGTAADTVGRLGAGANGTLLSPDSTQTTGLAYIQPNTLPGDDYWEFDGIATPSTPASGKGRLYAPSSPTGLRRPGWLEASGQITTLGGVLLRYAGNPYKDVVNTLLEQSIFATAPTIYAGVLGTDRALRITLLGDVLQNTGVANGFTLRFKYGSTTWASPETVGDITSNATRYGWRASAWIAARGATATQIGEAELIIANTSGVSGGGIAAQPSNNYGAFALHNSLAENSATNLTLDITLQPGSASANLSVRVFTVLVEWL